MPSPKTGKIGKVASVEQRSLRGDDWRRQLYAPYTGLVTVFRFARILVHPALSLARAALCTLPQEHQTLRASVRVFPSVRDH